MGIASTPGLPPEFANPLEVGRAERSQSPKAAISKSSTVSDRGVVFLKLSVSKSV
jgi:hypothetical protein